MNTNFDNLPGNSRLWVYQASRELTEEEQASLTEGLLEFSQQWAAHGKELTNGFLLAYNRFLIIAVDESTAGASGCSIDSSVAVIRKYEEAFQLSFFDRMTILYKENGELKGSHMNEFSRLIEEGSVTENTIVFNNMVTNKADWERSWELPVKESWQRRYL